jgi:hypothetical protein
MARGAMRLDLPETAVAFFHHGTGNATQTEPERLKMESLCRRKSGVLAFFIHPSSSQPIGFLGLSPLARIARMATAVSGSAKRIAPLELLVRINRRAYWDSRRYRRGAGHANH